MPAPEPDDSIKSRLRSSTHDLHQRIESRIGRPESIDAHLKTLIRFFGFVEPWEALAMPGVVDLRSSLGDRRKVSMLKNDLHDLGLSDDSIAQLPRCTALPGLHNIPSILGSMYVFEGATLGGQVLSVHLEKHLGMQNGVGYSYYKSYGTHTGQMWRNFTSVLTINIPRNSYDAAIQSACETFEKLCEWFERGS